MQILILFSPEWWLWPREGASLLDNREEYNYNLSLYREKEQSQANLQVCSHTDSTL